jgi:hypothetical protein
MPTLTLTFANALNISVAQGDTAYYVALTESSTGFRDGTNEHQSNISGATNNSIVEIGEIASVNFSTNVITVTTTLPDNTVTTSHMILFSKDNAVNMSSILGYYAEVKMTNTSTSEAELFQVSADMFESSK